MKAVILAAGQGNRLRPLTNDRPKVLVELNGRSILDRQLAVLRDAGVEQVAVVAGYHAEKFTGMNIPVYLNPRWETSNMVTSLFSAGEFLQSDEDVLICYGDIVYEPRVLKALLQCQAPLALTSDIHWQQYWSLRMEDVLDDVETFECDDKQRLISLGKKPSSLDEVQGQYMGLIKISGTFNAALHRHYLQLDRSAPYDGKDFDNMYMTSFIQSLVDAGVEVEVAEVNAGWLELDTLEDVQLCEGLHQQGRLHELYSDW